MFSLKNIFKSSAVKPAVVHVIKKEEFKNKIQNNNTQLIDVRTAMEFHSGTIKHAKNIDFFSKEFAAKCNKLKKNEPVYLFCRSGMRSHKAAQKLAKLGFTSIYDLKGGILNYYK